MDVRKPPFSLPTIAACMVFKPAAVGTAFYEQRAATRIEDANL